MITTERRYYCDLCGKEVPKKDEFLIEHQNPLIILDFGIYHESLYICGECARKIDDVMDGIRTGNKADEKID